MRLGSTNTVRFIMKRLVLICITLLAFCLPTQLQAGSDVSQWEGTSTGKSYTGDIDWEMTKLDDAPDHYAVTGTIKVKFNHRDHGRGKAKIKVRGEVINGFLEATGNGRGTVVARSFKLRVHLTGNMNGHTGNGTVVSDDGVKLIEGTWEITRL